MPYTYTKVDDLEKTTMVGNHQCVALVRHYAGAPATLAWKQGEAVLGNRLLRKGTAIATFLNASMRISNKAITRPCIWGRPWTVSSSWTSGGASAWAS